MSLTQRTTTAIAWNTAASLAQAAILFVRSVLLARLLPVEVFGVYALATAVVTITAILPNFGLAGAFLHRAPETEDEEAAAAVHFTLKLLFTAVWMVVLLGAAWLFTTGATRTALVWLTLLGGGLQLAQTPRLILMRRVEHRRLAVLQLLDAVLTTAVALPLAWQGVTLWALLATDVVTFVLAVTVLFLWRPVWRPRLALRPHIRRYFLRFGSRNVVADLLLRALDEIDDLWTGVFLGQVALGYYSRAYTFATYPRRVLATPVNLVAGGAYAELKGQRARLSQAFFRVNALLVRSGFYFAGVLLLIAPEFIRLLLGAKWLPMLTAFRLMLLFTLLDPLRLTIAHLFVAVGEPQRIGRARFVQLLVLVAGLFVLGGAWGINGVAVAVDGMLFVGIALLLWQTRPFVDVSLWRLFAVPTAALLLGLFVAAAGLWLWPQPLADLWSAVAKAALFTLPYAALLLLWEREQLREWWALARQALRPSAAEVG